MLGNQDGFSMVGILITASIGVTIMLALGHLLTMQSKQVFKLEDKSAALDLKHRFQAIFAKPQTCRYNLETKSIGPAGKIPLNVIKGPNNTNLFNLSNPPNDREGFIKIKSAHVRNVSGGMGLDFSNPAPQQGTMQFVAEVESIRSEFEFKELKFDLSVRIQNGRITTCSTDIEGMVPGTLRGCREFVVEPYEPFNDEPSRFHTKNYSCPDYLGPALYGTSWRLIAANCLGDGKLVVNNIGLNSMECLSVGPKTIAEHVMLNPAARVRVTCCELVE